ncbi:MAG: tRNA 2-thiouridine(34) synthase MnmA [bacterium]
MKIAILLSGGVDSSVALRLLQEQGHRDITAFYLKVWLEDELAYLGDCPWETDLEYCRAVCNQADVPLEVVSLQAEYLNKIVQYSLVELRAGRTPSSDILCNQHIKFGAFFDKIDASYEKVASGHYAKIEEQKEIFYLKKSSDPVKDQTYFLSYLDQKQLGRALFPLGNFTKKQVREYARQFDLPNRDRKDSQGICFLGKINYTDFVKFHLGEKTGDIIDVETGQALGVHKGYWLFTIGQRQGMGLGNGPWFVVRKDITKNIVYVTHRQSLSTQARDKFTVVNVHWISTIPRKDELEVKIRHAPEINKCKIRELGSKRLEVKIAIKESGIAAGQFAVFYDGEVCLGGGVIE